MGKLERIKQLVRVILEEEEPTRNDDFHLWIRLCVRHYRSFLSWSESKRAWFVALEAIHSVPSLASCIRYRAMFQSRGLYLPTDPLVLARRFKDDRAQADFKRSLDY